MMTCLSEQQGTFDNKNMYLYLNLYLNNNINLNLFPYFNSTDST